MKVHELIERLSTVDPEAKVIMYGNEEFNRALSVISNPDVFDNLYSKSDSFSSTFPEGSYVIIGDHYTKGG